MYSRCITFCCEMYFVVQLAPVALAYTNVLILQVKSYNSDRLAQIASCAFKELVRIETQPPALFTKNLLVMEDMLNMHYDILCVSVCVCLCVCACACACVRYIILCICNVGAYV